MKEFLIVASRGRNQNKAVRSVDLAVYRGYSRASISYAVKELRNKNYLEVNKDGICNTLTTVLKDNYVIEIEVVDV